MSEEKLVPEVEELEELVEEEFVENTEDTEELEEESKIPSGVYQNNISKASENKSSAISLLIVGALGAVMVALSWFEMLPFSIGGSRNLMSHSVLFVFFVLFIVLGVVSALNARKYKNLVGEEEIIKDSIRAYLSEAFTKESLEEIEFESDEEAYFNRMNYMREQLKAHFSENHFDDTLLESLLDEYYDTIFG